MAFACKLGHKFNRLPDGSLGCTCTRCGHTLDLSDLNMRRHDWDGCRCRVCGQVRVGNDDIHSWNGCTCVKCGKVRHVLEDGHRFANASGAAGADGAATPTAVCQICGQVLSKDALLAFARLNPKEWGNSGDHIRLSKLVPKRAVEALSPADADDIIVACYEASVARGPYVFGHYDVLGLAEFVRPSNLARLFLADRDDIYWFRPNLSEKQIIELVNAAPDAPGWNDAARRKLLMKWKIADGRLVTRCDLGGHQWRYVDSEQEYVGEHYYKTANYRCVLCGATKSKTESEKL